MDRHLRRVVITGPTGAIGKALCEELVKENVKVYAICRPGSHRAAMLPEHPLIQPIFCDISKLSELSKLISEDADAFYHFAWAHTIGLGRNDMPAQIENIQYTMDAVHAAAALGCKVFIGAGSQAEYGRVEGVLKPETPCFPENGYGMAKLCAGQMSRVECEKLDLDHIWTRILSVYGPGDGPSTMITSVIRQLLNGEKPALTEGVQKWDYLFSQDAARAFVRLGQCGISGKTYVLGSGNARPLKSYIEELRDAIDDRLPLGFGEVPYGPLQVMHLEADISELTTDTGFVPSVSFAEGIRRTIEKFR